MAIKLVLFMLITPTIKVNFVTLPAGWLIIENPTSATSWFVLALGRESLRSIKAQCNPATHSWK